MERHMNRRANRERLYQLRMQVGVALTLALLILLAKADIQGRTSDVQMQAARTHVPMLLIPPTVLEKKIIPPAPRIPVAVSDDEVLDESLTFDAELLDLVMADILTDPPPVVEEPDYEESGIHVLVEEMPEIIGGIAAIMKEIRYPEMAKKAGVEGRVMVQFVIDETGALTNPVVVRSLGAGCDDEVLRALGEMKFKPGKQRGVPVSVRMTIPITFKLR